MSAFGKDLTCGKFVLIALMLLLIKQDLFNGQKRFLKLGGDQEIRRKTGGGGGDSKGTTASDASLAMLLMMKEQTRNMIGRHFMNLTSSSSDKENSANDNRNNAAFVFPSHPPPPVRTCRVQFKDSAMNLCHIVPWGANFGDELGPALTKRLLQYHYWPCSTADIPVLNLDTIGPPYDRNVNTTKCFWTVGSVMFLSRAGDHFWGTGRQPRFKGINCVRQQPLHIHSVRGPKTLRFLQNECGAFYHNTTTTKQINPVGDPGFLIPFLFPEYNTYNQSQSKHPICIIPHKKDEDHPELESLSRPNTTPETTSAAVPPRILSVQRHWQDMVHELLDCQYVVSSSLHGVVLADAFGIPNKLWQSNREHFNKYRDYYNSFGPNGFLKLLGGERGVGGVGGEGGNDNKLASTTTRSLVMQGKEQQQQQQQQPPRSYEQAMYPNLTQAIQPKTIQEASKEVLSLEVRQQYSRLILESFPWELFEELVEDTAQ